MVAKKKPRKRVHTGVETAVLAKSARRCALCFKLNGDLTEKHGQIAHLDGNRSNAAEDNLAFMCLAHHSVFDSKTKQHKNYTVLEVKNARAKLYDLVTKDQHLTLAAALPYLEAEADKKILRNFMERVPSSGSIRFLRTNNFAGFSFERKQLDDISAFLYDHDGPEHEFLNPELEIARQKFKESCDDLLGALAINTWPTHNKGYYSIPPEWESEDPKRFNEVVSTIHAAADAVCTTYDKLIRLARKNLAV